MTSETQASAEVDPRRSHEMPPWAQQERRREAAELRRTSTLVELVCVLAVVAAFIWLLKDADLYVGDATAVWFAPVAIALYGARKTGTLERRWTQIESSLSVIESGSSVGSMDGRSIRRGRVTFARLAWVGFVALTVVLATIGYQASGSDAGDDDSEEDGAVVSGQRL